MAMFDWERALEGLAGNETYRGADHPLLRPLPERYREPLGSLFEDAVTFATLASAGASIATGAIVTAPWWVAGFAAAVVSIGVYGVLSDLGEEDSDVADIPESVFEDSQRLMEAVGLDDATRVAAREFVEAAQQGLPPPRLRLP